jgi:hypothetical protein
MESHHKWGIAFIAVGLALELLFPILIVFDTILIVVGIALILFGGREKKIEGVS